PAAGVSGGVAEVAHGRCEHDRARSGTARRRGRGRAGRHRSGGGEGALAGAGRKRRRPPRIRAVLCRVRRRAGPPRRRVRRGPQALVLGGGTLWCIEPESGKMLWERELAAAAEEATVHEGAIAVLGGGAVCTFSTRDGEPRQRADVRWARQLLAEDDGALIALGPGGAAMRLDGRKRWSIAAEGNAEPAAVLRRGILLLQRGASELYDVSDGILV